MNYSYQYQVRRLKLLACVILAVLGLELVLFRYFGMAQNNSLSIIAVEIFSSCFGVALLDPTLESERAGYTYGVILGAATMAYGVAQETIAGIEFAAIATVISFAIMFVTYQRRMVTERRGIYKDFARYRQASSNQ